MLARHLLAPLAGLAILATPARAQSSAPPDTTALRQEVQQRIADLTSAFNAGDRTRAAAFYADNAVLMNPNDVGPAGRAAIDAYFARMPAGARWTLDVKHVAGTRDAVWHTGRSTLVFGTPERKSEVQFLVLWRRQPGGELRIELDYYHLPEPPMPPRR